MPSENGQRNCGIVCLFCRICWLVLAAFYFCKAFVPISDLVSARIAVLQTMENLSDQEVIEVHFMGVFVEIAKFVEVLFSRFWLSMLLFWISEWPNYIFLIFSLLQVWIRYNFCSINAQVSVLFHCSPLFVRCCLEKI